jgi:hypothetical protein
MKSPEASSSFAYKETIIRALPVLPKGMLPHLSAAKDSIKREHEQLLGHALHSPGASLSLPRCSHVLQSFRHR